jgi:hypothetical protein
LTDEVGIPFLALQNGKPFVIWEDAMTSIRVKTYNGVSWEVVDDNKGLQKTLAVVSYNPALTLCNGKLYAIWSELKASDVTRQLRAASY